MPSTRGNRHWNPEWEYTLAHEALRERLGQLIGDAAVYARVEGLNAVWTSRVAPRKIGNVSIFSNTELAVYLFGSLTENTTLAQVSLGTGRSAKTRVYPLHQQVLPEGLNQGTAVLDERVRLALEGDLIPDVGLAHQRYEALMRASEMLRQSQRELPAGSDVQTPEAYEADQGVLKFLLLESKVDGVETIPAGSCMMTSCRFGRPPMGWPFTSVFV